ncbi:hypothetical protein [Sphingobium yanoikuyae]|uniref:hypothetical protein n=1 Tax=Sphingobium yanoikuyae TaxID=13690 RepID=UPI0024332C4B|nr:hypothetical protein [Sphingobium yanoikuyae]
MRNWPFSLKLGLGLLALGCGPLVVFLIADEIGLVRDPNPNPIGLGLLFVFSVPPALCLTLFGLARAAWCALNRF